MYDESNRWYMDETISQLQGQIQEKYPDMPETTEIGLHLEVDADGDEIGCYYLCDMANEEVFWLDEVPPGFFSSLTNLHIVNREHLSLGAQKAYWEHIYLFPHGRIIDAKMVNTVRTFAGDLGYYICDKETSRTSTSPFSPDKLSRFLQIVNVPLKPDEIAPVHYITMLGRLLSLVLTEKFMRYHGTIYAQLNSNATVYNVPTRRHSMWFRIATWLFGFTPKMYLDRLKEIWVDQKVDNSKWCGFLDALQADWTASITPGTVILSANVGFLAIQSVDQADRTAGQIVSYMSIVLSIGNIFACTILARHHRPSMWHLHDAATACGYFKSSTHAMEKLAVILSIPAALFLWGTLTFVIAVLWVSFYETNLETRVAVSITMVITILCIFAIVDSMMDSPSTAALLDVRATAKHTSKLVKKMKTMMSGGRKFRTLSA
ncbi:hypothetical protein C8Q76DRAFT_724546 [Earliella scabrosa]|nr:hypothetical protein C8Q76DRAFT_724546 [Earliella scabrosa]